jgi:hypothetical protein
MKELRRHILTALLPAVVLLGGLTALALAQSPPSSIVGTQERRTAITGVQTLTAAAPGTFTSTDQGGYGSTIICVYNQTAHTGSPTVVFSLEGKFATTYVSLLSSASIVATDGTTALSVGPGVTTTTNVGAGIPLPAQWRSKTVITGGGSTTTGHVDCSLD